MRRALVAILLAGCSPEPHVPVHVPVPVPDLVSSPSTDPAPAPAVASWSAVTRSPWPVAPPTPDSDPRERSLATLCGGEDDALSRVARDIALDRARGLGTPDTELVVAKLRAAGEPHPRPRIIVASGQAPLDETKLQPQLMTQAAGSRGPSRCGVAIAKTPDGGEVLVALRIEALADLAPLPTRARTGEWLTFEARIHVGARAAKVVVLGPHGAPRSVPTSLDTSTGIARARLALDQPGAFTLQLVGDVAEGPRPLLEARVFADVVPSAPGEEPPAPGEDDPAAASAPDAVALTRMVAALRAGEGFPALAPNAQLDSLARAHAERMRDRRSVAHDLGDGDFRDRFELEGTLDARAVGENVAHAPTIALAHRALHASPSHRINLLRVDYTHMGIGTARAPDGTVYVCETFAAAPKSR